MQIVFSNAQVAKLETKYGSPAEKELLQVAVSSIDVEGVPQAVIVTGLTEAAFTLLSAGCCSNYTMNISEPVLNSVDDEFLTAEYDYYLAGV